MIELDLNNWIYSSLPEELQPITTSEERSEVFRLLSESRAPVTAKRISQVLGYRHKDNSVKVRKIITELILFGGVPIISGNKGFRIAKNRKELVEYHKSLNKRLLGLRRRMLGIERIIAVGGVL